MSHAVRAGCAVFALGFGVSLSGALAPSLAEERAQRAAIGAARYENVGEASWYGRWFHGRRTASGEIFNMNGLTAAHRTLPFATLVRVTNLENGRSVVVRVTDRGPFARRRVIDLSVAGAHAIGLIESGVARVRVTIAGEEE